MSKRIPTHVDLPITHLEGLEYYTPPKARYPYEITRRQTLPKGVLIAEYQRRGLAVAITTLQHIRKPEDKQFSGRTLGASGMNSAWHDFVQNTRFMRRESCMPKLAGDDKDYEPSSAAILVGAIGELSNAAYFADRHIEALLRRSPEAKKRQRSLGRIIGNASLTLACLGMDDSALNNLVGRPEDLVQLAVRRQCLMIQNQAVIMAGEIGSPPTLAQLADPDSDMSVFWRRNAPTGALEAFELATQTHRAA